MFKKIYYILVPVILLVMSEGGKRFGCTDSSMKPLIPEEQKINNPYNTLKQTANADLTDSDLPVELADKVTVVDPNQANTSLNATSNIPSPPISPNVAKATIVQPNQGGQGSDNSGGFIGNFLSNALGLNQLQNTVNNANMVNMPNMANSANNSATMMGATVPFNQFLSQIQSKLPYQLDKDVVWHRADLTAPQQVTFSYAMPRALQNQLPLDFHQKLEPIFQGWVCHLAPQMIQYGFDVTILLYDKQNQL
jgi:hypothetical protein